MKILVACEFSGIVRSAFRKLGHDAWSCDILPPEDGSVFHIQEDVFKHLKWGWDLMVAHPPCTYLANSSSKHLYIGGKKENGPNLDRWQRMEDGADFFRSLLFADIPKIAVENPIMHKHGIELIGRRQDQIIQPWQFGHGETKATCLWLKGLPKLIPTKIVEGRNPRVHKLGPGPDRWKERSRTLQGIAEAMGEQWGG